MLLTKTHSVPSGANYANFEISRHVIDFQLGGEVPLENTLSLDRYEVGVHRLKTKDAAAEKRYITLRMCCIIYATSNLLRFSH